MGNSNSHLCFVVSVLDFLITSGARCSSVVRAFAHGAMDHSHIRGLVRWLTVIVALW